MAVRDCSCSRLFIHCPPPLSQVWNHPWVLKLDEDKKFEKEERRQLFMESDGDSFIVSGSEVETEEEEEEEDLRRKSKKKKKKKACLVGGQTLGVFDT